MKVGVKDFQCLLHAAPLPPPVCKKIEYTNLAQRVNGLTLWSHYFQRTSAFTPIHRQWEFHLKRLRFKKIDIPQHTGSPGYNILLDAWASQCCFLEGDYPTCSVRMSVESDSMPEVGTIMRWVLHGGSDARSCQWIDWQKRKGPKITNSKEKMCMCTALRAPDFCIPWDMFTDPSLENGRIPGTAADLPASSPIKALMWTLLSECRAAHCPHGLICDSTTTLFVSWESPADSDPRGVWYEVIPHSAAYCVAAAISIHGASLVPSWLSRRVLGAQNHKDAGVAVNTDPRRFRDFDIYEMEFNRELYKEFLRWKAVQYDAAIAAPLLPGTELPLEPDVFPRKLEPRRCPFPWAPLPEDCVTSIFARRPRCARVDQLLRSGAGLAFRLKENLRPVTDTGFAYSQVFSGRLVDTASGEAVGPELCLKLLDERRFRVPTLAEYDSPKDRHSRLWTFYASEEILSREEAAYSRFSGSPEDSGGCPDLQGLMIPHCYGFHEFTVTDAIGSLPVLGVLLELIDGIHLESLIEEMIIEPPPAEDNNDNNNDNDDHNDNDNDDHNDNDNDDHNDNDNDNDDDNDNDEDDDNDDDDTQETSQTHDEETPMMDSAPEDNTPKPFVPWTHDERVALLKRIRNIPRVLSHAHITQADWHGRQILCIRRQDAPRRDAGVELVLVDFGFTMHYTDIRNAVIEYNDTGRLCEELWDLGLGPALFKDVGWGEKDEWEN